MSHVCSWKSLSIGLGRTISLDMHLRQTFLFPCAGSAGHDAMFAISCGTQEIKLLGSSQAITTQGKYGRALGHGLVCGGRALGHYLIRRGRALGHGLVRRGRAPGRGLVRRGRALGPSLIRRGRALGHGLVCHGRALGHGLFSHTDANSTTASSVANATPADEPTRKRSRRQKEAQLRLKGQKGGGSVPWRCRRRWREGRGGAEARGERRKDGRMEDGGWRMEDGGGRVEGRGSRVVRLLNLGG